MLVLFIIIVKSFALFGTGNMKLVNLTIISIFSDSFRYETVDKVMLTIPVRLF